MKNIYKKYCKRNYENDVRRIYWKRTILKSIGQIHKNKQKISNEIEKSKGLKEEKLKPKKHLSPIMQKLSERKPVPLHYIGTSFGITKELF